MQREEWPPERVEAREDSIFKDDVKDSKGLFPTQLEANKVKVHGGEVLGYEGEGIYAKSVTSSLHGCSGPPHVDSDTEGYSWVYWTRDGKARHHACDPK